jgi:hypothetical protein
VPFCENNENVILSISYFATQIERVATSKCDRNDIPRMMWVEMLACAMFSLLLSHTIFNMLDVLMTHPTTRQTESPIPYPFIHYPCTCPAISRFLPEARARPWRPLP